MFYLTAILTVYGAYSLGTLVPSSPALWVACGGLGISLLIRYFCD